MRDWAKTLANEALQVPTQTVPETKATNFPPQITSAAIVFFAVFALLTILRPPFVESADKERPMEPRKLQWHMVLAASASAAGIVILSSV